MRAGNFRLAGVIPILALTSLCATSSADAEPPFLENPLPVTEGTPIQLSLRGEFKDGDPFLTETAGLSPRFFTVPEGQSMLIKHVTCQASRVATETHQFVITLVAERIFEGGDITLPDPVVELIPTAVYEGQAFDRAVVSATVHAYVNIPSPAAGAPAVDDLLTLSASRNGTGGIGQVFCTVGAVLFPR